MTSSARNASEPAVEAKARLNPRIRLEINRFQCRGLRREDAAAYVGVSPSKFDDWVKRRLMPSPKRQDSVVVWDRFALDLAFGALPDSVEGNADDDLWKDLQA